MRHHHHRIAQISSSSGDTSNLSLEFSFPVTETIRVPVALTFDMNL